MIRGALIPREHVQCLPCATACQASTAPNVAGSMHSAGSASGLTEGRGAWGGKQMASLKAAGHFAAVACFSMPVHCWSLQAAMRLALLLTGRGSVMLHARAACTGRTSSHKTACMSKWLVGSSWRGGGCIRSLSCLLSGHHKQATSNPALAARQDPAWQKAKHAPRQCQLVRQDEHKPEPKHARWQGIPA